MIRPTVRLRLTAWYASIFLLAGSALLAVSYVIVSNNTSSFSDRVAEEMARHGVPRNLSVTSNSSEANGTPSQTKGERSSSGGPRHSGARPGPTVNAETKGATPLPKPTRAYLAKVERIQAAAERTVRGQMRREVALDFGLALAGTTLLSLLAGWLVAGRALRPVSRITATARRVAAEGDLGERIGLTGPADELREFAETFDAMLARLDSVFASQRRFVADASHELRTPLAVIRAEVEERLDDSRAGEAELREMAAVVRDAVARTEDLIASLLTLTRSQHEIRHREPVDLATLTHEASQPLVEAAQARRLSLELPDRPAPLTGDPQLLERLLTNLLENAVRYNHEGGFVRVEAAPNGEAVTLTVSNSGPLVPTAAVQRLFEPFFRIDDSRSRETGGAGLGLAIVAAIATAHGGSARAAARDQGGLVVSVTLPRTAEAGAGPSPAG